MKALLLIYAAGSYIDYLTTAWAIPRGAVEQNPLGTWLIAEYGVVSLLYTKIGCFVFYLVLVWIMRKFDEKLSELWGEPCGIPQALAFAAVWIVALGQWLICGSNFWQMRIAMALGW